MPDRELIDKICVASKRMRHHIINMTYNVGNVGAHLGGSLSSVEILACLYLGVLKLNIDDPNWENRDRLILSKGHAAMALYAAMAESGYLDVNQLSTFKQDYSLLCGHPSLNGLKGIEFASGSLGQGLSQGVGTCLGLRRKNNSSSRVYVLLGDGECDEGSIWEAAASASHFQTNQLVAIIDCNRLQYDGETIQIMNMDPMADKWESFGWDVNEVKGHDIADLLEAFEFQSRKPYVIIANTIKGKGISFMENDYRYHNARLSKSLYEKALVELGAEND